MNTLSVVVGSAGHIDHGKTALIRALTGIDCDRLPAEKARGITIDLGFAHGEWDGIGFGFVDVPGHERFVRNMLAGASGIDLVLLVVAGDEGVMPQTREHLDICRFLGLASGVIAITKADRADPAFLELVRADVAELVTDSFLAGAPIVFTSAVSGQGVAELKAALAAAARASRRATLGAAGEPRLPIDRAFVVKGFGPVVTGTLVSGAIAAGDRLLLMPEMCEVRARGLQSHGLDRPRALAGERVSVNLAGVEIGELRRGQTLASPGSLVLGRRLTVELEAAPGLERPLAHGERVRFHLGTSDAFARLALAAEVPAGGRAAAQLRLATAVPVRAGDRFVLRSATATLAGGRVLDPALPRVLRSELARVAAVLTGTDTAAAIELRVLAAGARGLPLAALAARTIGSASPPAKGGAIEVWAETWFPRALRQRAEEKVRSWLTEVAQADPTATSVALSELRQRALAHWPAGAIEAVIGEWTRVGVLTITGDRVALPGRQGGLGERESKSARALIELYQTAGLAAAPSPTAAAAELGLKPQIAQGLVRHLLERGELVKLPGECVVAKSAVQAAISTLRASGQERIDIAAFKELFGLSRKLAIPLLEYFDQSGVTRREGDLRRIVR